MSPLERLQKILADRGIASRRKAEDLIREGRVTLNGQIAHVGDKADPIRDAIKVNGRRLAGPPEKIYLVLNKPKNVVATTDDPEGRTTVFDLVHMPARRLFSVGRLDYDAEGVLLFTNDGDLAHKLAHPSFEIPRTYWVKLKGKPQKEEIQKLSHGVRLEDGFTAPCHITPIRETEGNSWVEMTLHQGRNRQVKRMWEKIGYLVLKLKRVSFAGVKLGRLQPGEYRLLLPEEVEKLRTMISSKVPPPQALRSLHETSGQKGKKGGT